MKRLLLALCLFTPCNVFAALQIDTTVTIDSIPMDSYVFDRGWKYRMEDNPAFASAAYDDHNWDKMDPTQPTPLIPDKAREGIGWMRIKFTLNKSLGRILLLRVYQRIAAEIYLNGKLVTKLGTIDAKLKTGSGYIHYDPIELNFNNEPVQLIAIRFANPDNIKYLSGYLVPDFCTLYLSNTRNLILYDRILDTFDLVLGSCASILILLTVLHLVFLYFNPEKSANLFLAAYTFWGAVFVLYIYSINGSQSVATANFLAILGLVALYTSFLCGIKALAVLFNFNVTKYYHILLALTMILCLIRVFNEKLGFLIFPLALLLVSIQLAVTFRAVYKKKRGAWIVAAGFFGGLIGVCIGVYVIFFISARYNIQLIILSIAYGLAILSPAFGISLFLFHEFALDSRLLQTKLIEVEYLSSINIAQEQEKQQLLADQNLILEQQVTQRTAELNKSLNHLKATQSQLIQSEKMASLGELTAGIAHEIQNPLNFVNNFSDVSVELVDEMDEELDNGDIAQAKAIGTDLKQNLAKIRHHGKRADAIVKGMLQHSQTGSGAKEATNINALAEECMRLSYHGIRAKDKSFNSGIVSHLDETLPKVNVVPQDMVRVMLNLFNNAFYAVNQKQKTAVADYKPEVAVITSMENGQVVIKVKDNGVGIPDAIKDKIMQPFFTTKPTGEGTGLGLSLTYDMVVKGHGGSIQVNSLEGEGSDFIITLPLT